MASQQFVIFSTSEPPDPFGGGGPPTELEALGSEAQILSAFAQCNTAPDGGGGGAGSITLYGPGMVCELPLGLDEIKQVMVVVKDRDTAWPVLAKICKGNGWRMLDPESGRTFM